MQEQFERALSKFTRNTEHLHEVFQMAAQRAPSDPIYIELSPGGFYTLTFGEVYEYEKLSGNLFIQVPRYSPEQMAYINTHWKCAPEEVPGFTEMLEGLHVHLTYLLDARRGSEERISESSENPLLALPRKGVTRDDHELYRAISNTRLI